MTMVERLRSITEPIEEEVVCKSKIRKWAYDNAYTLIFVSLMFFITWTIVVIVNYGL